MIADGVDIGEALLQYDYPLVYVKRLYHWKHGLSTYKKELWALIYAFDKWQTYLGGVYFVIKTDHHSMKFCANNNSI